ncbi:hypothetical protein NESM_000067800 [Novymonas esmeraldas]|uniref:Calcium uniporter protein C-terminal domain-containing protein n=1 Tax=Novymonas esmeraldas TaxID=1808958 RepID=A0AAW0F431_9TRYP
MLRPLLHRRCMCPAATTHTSACVAAVARRWAASTAAPPPRHRAAAAAAVDVATLRAARDGHLRRTLDAKRQELAAMERVKAQCDAAAARYPDAFMKGIFAFLVMQTAVLFDWTYVHFDWALVEPITYLVGYSATWIAIAWYGTMQHEFGYESLRRLLQSTKSRKLYAVHGFDVQAHELLKMEVAKLDAVVRSLHGL